MELSRSEGQQRLTRSIPIVRRLFRKTNAKHISQCFRKEAGFCDDKSLTYGEVDAASFMQILALTVKSPSSVEIANRKFVDLGCGAGMPCICAAMSPYGFSSILGIEIVGGLVDLARSLHASLVAELSSNGDDAKPTTQTTRRNVTKYVGDEIDLVPLVISVLSKNLTTTPQECNMSLDLLATEVCKLCGHKSYKSSLKKHKTFLKLLQSNEVFRVSDDGKMVAFRGGSAYDDGSRVDENDVNEHDKDDSLQKDLMVTPCDRQIFYPLPPIDYIHGSIFDYDWSDCDVAYTASLLFSEDMMLQLVPLVLRMKPGSWFISLQQLPLAENQKHVVKLMNDSFFKMSWQMARVFTYQVQNV